MTKRLTMTYKDEVTTYDPIDVYNNSYSQINFQNILRKLAHYEDLEEQGRLIELPRAVGDTVYLISSQYSKCSKHNERFDEYYCQGCEEDDCDSRKEYFIHANYNVSLEWIARAMENNRFGNTVFLTKEEAEAKLKERGEQE